MSGFERYRVNFLLPTCYYYNKIAPEPVYSGYSAFSYGLPISSHGQIICTIAPLLRAYKKQWVFVS